MNRKLKYLIISNSIFILAASALVPVYGLFVESIHGGIELAGVLFGLGFLSSSITSLVVTKFHDGIRFENRMMKLNFFLRGIIWIVIACIPTLPVLFIGQILIGMTDGFGSPVFNELFARQLDHRKHMKEWGIWQFVAALAIAVGSAASGYVVTRLGFQFLFLMMAALAFISLFVYQAGEKKISRRK